MESKRPRTLARSPVDGAPTAVGSVLVVMLAPGTWNVRCLGIVTFDTGGAQQIQDSSAICLGSKCRQISSDRLALVLDLPQVVEDVPRHPPGDVPRGPAFLRGDKAARIAERVADPRPVHGHRIGPG